MASRTPRLRIASDGSLEIVDPTPEDLPLLHMVDPGFAVRSAPLQGFRYPRFMAARDAGAGIARDALGATSTRVLWRLHRHAVDRLRGGAVGRACGEASVLDLKVELAERQLAGCRLCARRCGADRRHGDFTPCGLGMEAFVAESYVHIAEEAPINPSLVVSLAGCGLGCRYCQQGAILRPAPEYRRLDADYWATLAIGEARSLSFAGGNPDESLSAVLRFLAAAPTDWRLPVVWNSHAYVPSRTVALLDGVIDVYLPDVKYGAEPCGRRCSGVANYPAVALRAVSAMLRQGVCVIARILVLPGHAECCHVPVLNTLARCAADGRLTVSVRGQYAPDWRISPKDGAMFARPLREEVLRVEQICADLGLAMVW